MCVCVSVCVCVCPTFLQQALAQGLGQQHSDIGDGVGAELQQRSQQVLRELLQRQTLLLYGQLHRTDIKRGGEREKERGGM